MVNSGSEQFVWWMWIFENQIAPSSIVFLQILIIASEYYVCHRSVYWFCDFWQALQDILT